MQGLRGSVLSLFTGAGGLDLGLEAAGFDMAACLEIDPVCADTLRENRPSWAQLNSGDVTVAARRVKPKDFGLEVGQLDLIAGGPPCQPFSVAAQWANTGRRGMYDDRAQTVVAMLDLVEAFLPRALFVENVAGFLRGETSASSFISERLAEINQKHGTAYDLNAQIVDAADYGVPQRRNRVIAIATRDGREMEMPAPTHIDAPVRAWDAIGDLAEADPPPIQGTWTALLASIPEGGNYQYLTARGGGEELFGYRTRYWSFLLKLAKDQPAWTLPASPGPSTGPFHWDNRPLTVRECLRLQSFPDEWRLAGSHRRRIKQAGNATPPLLAEVVGRALLAHLRGAPADEQKQQPKLHRERREGAVPKAVPPVPVPEHFRSLMGSKKAHPGAGKGPSPRGARSTSLAGRSRAVLPTERSVP